jgi:hypothetical protein
MSKGKDHKTKIGPAIYPGESADHYWGRTGYEIDQDTIRKSECDAAFGLSDARTNEVDPIAAIKQTRPALTDAPYSGFPELAQESYVLASTRQAILNLLTDEIKRLNESIDRLRVRQDLVLKTCNVVLEVLKNEAPNG